MAVVTPSLMSSKAVFLSVFVGTLGTLWSLKFGVAGVAGTMI